MYRGDGTNVFLKDAPSLVFTTLGIYNCRLLLSWSVASSLAYTKLHPKHVKILTIRNLGYFYTIFINWDQASGVQTFQPMI